MKIVVTLALFVSTMAFANPTTTTTTTTTTPAATEAKGTMDHSKMGHGKTKAATATTTECKTKAADGKCLDEVKK